MQQLRSYLHSDFFRKSAFLLLISAPVYLWFVPQFGYFHDDWYLMYAAGARGPSVFWDVFAVDRPLRALVMIPAYSLFGADPLYYNLSVYLFRLLGSLCFLWILRTLWPQDRRLTFTTSVLFLLYPGFLSQPNAIDYLCHIVGLAAGMLSIVLTIRTIQSNGWREWFVFYLISILSGWFYLGQIEWYIGLEFFRFAAILLLSFRAGDVLRVRLIRFLKISLPATLIAGVFLVWRLFFFTSERGATDVDLQFSSIRTQPLTFLASFVSALFNDFLDVVIRAWAEPLVRLTNGVNGLQLAVGLGMALFVLLLCWMAYRLPRESNGENESDQPSNWKMEMILTGLGLLLCGLLPVLLVGRTVDFKSFSRYTLIASVGVAMIWPVLFSYIPRLWLRNIFLAAWIACAAFTHYVNGLVHARQTAETRNFWWQVSWRIPQLKNGTTLIAHYTVVSEEDYFTWGPANLIYYPKSQHAEYVQPSVYALLLNQETVEKVIARESQDYSNRRSIRTYPNYNNILILTKPTESSCVQVIDLKQVELSSAEDARIPVIAAYSEAEHILTGEPFHRPSLIPFGPEPAVAWCYFYEKAAYARQLGDWEEVARLGEQAFAQGFTARDLIEWMPFLQAYAHRSDIASLEQIAPLVTSDNAIAGQVCEVLMGMSLDGATQDRVHDLFCLK